MPKSDVLKSDAFLKFSGNFLEILPKFVPKSDTFFGISLNSKCVTFWHDNVVWIVYVVMCYCDELVT